VKRGALIVLAMAIAAYLFARPPAIGLGGIDFTAFYCAAHTLSSGENPYSYEPLRQCEHEHVRWSDAASIVVAPLPPYALALIAPVASLGYRQASLLWFALLVAGAAVAIWAVIELTGLPLLAVSLPLVMALLLQSLPTGSLAPIVIALLCAATVALTRRRWNLSALLLGLACIEPHVAAPALVAAFILVDEMRGRIAVAAAAIAALSLVAGGVALNAQYFLQVLPGHARFELGSIVQFGLSSMLHNFGVPDGPALAIGAAQYALFVALGIRLAALYRRIIPAVVVLVPMAFAVIGGVYIHLTQLAAVLPLGFVAARRKPSGIAWTGIALLAFPWNLLNALGPHMYLANALAYAGVGCVLWSAFAGSSLLRNDDEFVVREKRPDPAREGERIGV